MILRTRGQIMIFPKPSINLRWLGSIWEHIPKVIYVPKDPCANAKVFGEEN